MRAFPLIAIPLLLCATACTQSSKLDSLWSDLSIAVPGYEKVENFDHPADAAKGDYFSVDLIQSSNQFGSFVSKLGLTQTNVLSGTNESWINVTSKINPKYPWHLSVKATAINGIETRYRTHIEGRQAYN